MMHTLYNAALRAAAPAAALWLRSSTRHRSLSGRLDPEVPAFSVAPIWLQACSVGEVNTAAPILAALHDRWPEVPVLLTVSTQSGRERAEVFLPDIPLAWFPFDHPGSVRRFVANLNPRLLVLIETEIWPNVVQETRRHGCPVAVINGRISDKHFARYQRYRNLLAPTFVALSAACMQSQTYAERMAALGADPGTIHVTGNTKFEGPTTTVEPSALANLRSQCGIPDEAAVLVFGSTRPGDEALAVVCWKQLCDRVPGLYLVVVPRHLKRLGEALAAFEEPVLLRSSVAKGESPTSERILVVDTVGELVAFYAMADVAVVGGSFYPGVEGHNPLEPAALATPAVFGPYMRNFTDPARLLTEGGGAVQVAGPEDLFDALVDLFDDRGKRQAMGERAQAVIAENQGAIDRTLDRLALLLDA